MAVFSAYKDYKASKYKTESHPNIYQQANGVFELLKKHSPETIDYLNEIGKENKKEITKQREKTPEEILMNELMSEFDSLYNEQEIISGGRRFVNYNKSFLSLDEYMALRLKELATQ
jgi:hypothetical protein